MRLDTESMPLVTYDQLRVEKPIEDEFRVKCYNDEAMTGKFSQFEDNEEHFSNTVFSLAAGSAGVQVNLEIDPVLHGWVKTLRLVNYLLALPRTLKHRKHLIPDKDSRICELGESKWHPTLLEI